MKKIRALLVMLDKLFYRKFDDWDEKKEILKQSYLGKGIAGFIKIVTKIIAILMNK